MNMARPSSSSVSCACTGIRTCGICEEQLAASSKYRHQFTYNDKTKRAELSIKNEAISFPFPGVLIYRHFVTAREENEITSIIDSNPWKESQSGRRKQDYGPKVNFKKKKVKVGAFNGLPGFMKLIVERLHALQELSDFNPVEICNLEYVKKRGSSIDPHHDDAWLWGERLLTLNLLSDTKLSMTLPEKHSMPSILGKCVTDLDIQSSELCVKVPLERRSVVVLYGPARHVWMHGIERSDVSDRRLCCTFRELSSEFLSGSMKAEGMKLLTIANSFSGDVVP